MNVNLIEAIALTVLLVIVGRFIFVSNSDSLKGKDICIKFAWHVDYKFWALIPCFNLNRTFVEFEFLCFALTIELAEFKPMNKGFAGGVEEKGEEYFVSSDSKSPIIEVIDLLDNAGKILDKGRDIVYDDILKQHANERLKKGEDLIFDDRLKPLKPLEPIGKRMQEEYRRMIIHVKRFYKKQIELSYKPEYARNKVEEYTFKILNRLTFRELNVLYIVCISGNDGISIDDLISEYGLKHARKSVESLLANRLVQNESTKTSTLIVPNF